MTTISEAIAAAYAADRAYETALQANGFKSRWDDDARQKRTPAVKAAYDAKVTADREMSAAFDLQRKLGDAMNGGIETCASYALGHVQEP